MPTRPPPPQKLLPPGQRFRSEIEKATAEGALLSGLMLQLTLSDAAKLRRDPSIETEAISFSDGHMRYLGVRVVEGSITSSTLVTRSAEDIAADQQPPAPEIAMAKGQKKSNKEVRKPKAEKAKPAPAGRDFLTPPGKAK